MREQHQKHKDQIKALKKKQDDADHGSVGDNDAEDQGALPACTGAKGENAGVDCKKAKKMKLCPGNKHDPALQEGEAA